MAEESDDGASPGMTGLLAEQARALVEHALFGICVVQEGMIRYANPGAAAMFSFEGPVDMVDRVALIDLVAIEDRAMVAEFLRRHDQGARNDLRYRFSGQRCDGSRLRVEIRGRAVDFAGQPAMIAMLLDVTDLQRDEDDLERRAASDELTGLPNRVLIFDRLQQAIVHARRNDELFAFLCLDLDGFKEINIRCGQNGGDQVLRIVAERLAGTLRASDSLARLGGDQFAVIARGLMFGDDVLPVVQRLRDALESPIGFAGQQFKLSASIGIALFPAAAEDANGLHRAAEAAMLASKQHGPGGYLLASSDGGLGEMPAP